MNPWSEPLLLLDGHRDEQAWIASSIKSNLLCSNVHVTSMKPLGASSVKPEGFTCARQIRSDSINRNAESDRGVGLPGLPWRSGHSKEGYPSIILNLCDKVQSCGWAGRSWNQAAVLHTAYLRAEKILQQQSSMTSTEPRYNWFKGNTWQDSRFLVKINVSIRHLDLQRHQPNKSNWSTFSAGQTYWSCAISS